MVTTLIFWREVADDELSILIEKLDPETNTGTISDEMWWENNSRRLKRNMESSLLAHFRISSPFDYTKLAQALLRDTINGTASDFHDDDLLKYVSWLTKQRLHQEAIAACEGLLSGRYSILQSHSDGSHSLIISARIGGTFSWDFVCLAKYLRCLADAGRSKEAVLLTQDVLKNLAMPPDASVELRRLSDRLSGRTRSLPFEQWEAVIPKAASGVCQVEQAAVGWLEARGFVCLRGEPSIYRLLEFFVSESAPFVGDGRSVSLSWLADSEAIFLPDEYEQGHDSFQSWLRTKGTEEVNLGQRFLHDQLRRLSQPGDIVPPNICEYLHASRDGVSQLGGGIGLPDILCWKQDKPEELFFVEVKGPGDRLRAHQEAQLTRLHDLGMQVVILRIKR
jgi:hypothetical protein